MCNNRKLDDCLAVLYVIIACGVLLIRAQTEGDEGYDYEGAYYAYEEGGLLGVEPSFDVPIVNVTVVEKQTAVLPCSIENLAKHKVTWSRITENDRSLKTLTFEDRRIVDDYRYALVRPYIKEWNLQIRDIEYEDQGHYLCTINTNPPQSKKVVLHVKVPPKIIDELSTGDVLVRENDTVALTCKVEGVPKPIVTWNRLPAMASNHERESKGCNKRTRGSGIGLTGEVLILENVTRYCDDVYECIADNGVNPRVVRKMKVTVQFPPEVEMPNKRIMQALGRETILECKVTAFPHASMYWEKSGEEIQSRNGKYEIEIFDDQNKAKILSLRVKQISEEDYGVYTCSASNALGRDSGQMVLEYYADNKKTESSTSRIPVIVPYHSTKKLHDETPKQTYIADLGKQVTRPPGSHTGPVAGELTNNDVARITCSTSGLLTLLCVVMLSYKFLHQT